MFPGDDSAVQHKPEVSESVRYSPERYHVIFDTKQELRLTTEEGALLLKCLQDGPNSSAEARKGIMATTSVQTI